MRIGLFSDTYHPSVNGITVVVDSMKRNLEAAGHTVYIVAPAPSLKWWHLPEKNVIRFAALRGLFFQESSLNFFFPPRQLRKIRSLKLDTIVIFTPAQVGLMGAYAAITDGIPLVSQYCTDLTEYVERYPSVMPAVLALFSTMPFALRANPKDMLRLSKKLAVDKQRHMSWKAFSVQATLTYLHDRCDLVVSVSPKVTTMLQTWGTKTEIVTIPTGVDKGRVDERKVVALKKRYGLHDKKVLLYVGRLGKEKNIDLIIDSLPHVLKAHADVKLVIVGDFNYRQVLEQKVNDKGLSEYVVFTGRVAMKDRWNYFALGDVFCFPSLTDTQALVVNEAALMGLPTVWCDDGINDILHSGKTGYQTAPKPREYSRAISDLLTYDVKRVAMGKEAQRLAHKLTEKSQTDKLVRAIKRLTKH